MSNKKVRKPVNFRLEEETIKWLNDTSKKQGCTKTELIRRLKKGFDAKLSLSKDDVKLLREMILQQIKIGVNINQISYYFNYENSLKKEVNQTEEFKSLKKELNEMKKLLLDSTEQISSLIRLGSGT